MGRGGDTKNAPVLFQIYNLYISCLTDAKASCNRQIISIHSFLAFLYVHYTCRKNNADTVSLFPLIATPLLHTHGGEGGRTAVSPSAGCSSTGLTTHRSQIAQPRRTLLQRSSSQLQKRSFDRLLFKFGTVEQNSGL